MAFIYVPIPRIFSKFTAFIFVWKASLSRSKDESIKTDVLRLLPIIRQSKIIMKPIALLNKCIWKVVQINGEFIQKFPFNEGYKDSLLDWKTWQAEVQYVI